MLLKAGIALMAFALAFAGAATVVASLSRDEPAEALAVASAPEPTVEPLVRTEPDVEPWVEKKQKPPPEPEPRSEPAPNPEPKPEPELRPEPEPAAPPSPRAEPQWPTPTSEQVEQATRPRHYELPDGAIMGLTIKALGLHDVPVFNSSADWALDNGVSHERGTSMPWSRSEQRNVYLQGHRLGWPGTGSHLVFYHLNRLERGDEVLLKNRDGNKYTYRVTETFIVEPNDSWVTGRVRDRDMVTLQTCTPIPSFEKRLIVRADRI